MDDRFDWTPCPAGQQLLDELLGRILERHSGLAELKQQMLTKTGTRLFDWLDHLIAPCAEGYTSRLEAAGFEIDAHGAYHHPRAVFPRVVIGQQNWGACVKVESLEDFITHLDDHTPLTPFGEVRESFISSEHGVDFIIVERHGSKGLSSHFSTYFPQRFNYHLERFRHRDRTTPNFSILTKLIDHAIHDLGRDAAASAFFQIEREYWMQRNSAAQAQYARQQSLGLGWANHDHHTYRCRREVFSQMITVFELLGLHCRERFYAGKEAGWGAQVMENSEAGIVVFADVDMTPDEVLEDFAHIPLPPKSSLGTVGLWCELHGDSLFEAGMHHLECQFDFESLAAGLKCDANINVMQPFSDLPHLKQQFTEGERWPVASESIERLLQAGKITSEQAESFLKNGAIGSHLENLERNDGFKGFNQSGINEIIQATDPRTA